MAHSRFSLIILLLLGCYAINGLAETYSATCKSKILYINGQNTRKSCPERFLVDPVNHVWVKWKSGPVFTWRGTQWTPINGTSTLKILEAWYPEGVLAKGKDGIFWVRPGGLTGLSPADARLGRMSGLVVSKGEETCSLLPATSIKSVRVHDLECQGARLDASKVIRGLASCTRVKPYSAGDIDEDFHLSEVTSVVLFARKVKDLLVFTAGVDWTVSMDDYGILKYPQIVVVKKGGHYLVLTRVGFKPVNKCPNPLIVSVGQAKAIILQGINKTGILLNGRIYPFAGGIRKSKKIADWTTTSVKNILVRNPWYEFFAFAMTRVKKRRKTYPVTCKEHRIVIGTRQTPLECDSIVRVQDGWILVKRGNMVWGCDPFGLGCIALNDYKVSMRVAALPRLGTLVRGQGLRVPEYWLPGVPDSAIIMPSICGKDNLDLVLSVDPIPSKDCADGLLVFGTPGVKQINIPIFDVGNTIGPVRDEVPWEKVFLVARYHPKDYDNLSDDINCTCKGKDYVECSISSGSGHAEEMVTNSDFIGVHVTDKVITPIKLTVDRISSNVDRTLNVALDTKRWTLTAQNVLGNKKLVIHGSLIINKSIPKDVRPVRFKIRRRSQQVLWSRSKMIDFGIPLCKKGKKHSKTDCIIAVQPLQKNNYLKIIKMLHKALDDSLFP